VGEKIERADAQAFAMPDTAGFAVDLTPKSELARFSHV
jgi:hypothetical protein